MISLEKAKKIIIEKQKKCYRCGKLFDPYFDTSIFLCNHTSQDFKMVTKLISDDLQNIVALCDNCNYIMQNRVKFSRDIS